MLKMSLKKKLTLIILPLFVFSIIPNNGFASEISYNETGASVAVKAFDPNASVPSVDASESQIFLDSTQADILSPLSLPDE